MSWDGGRSGSGAIIVGFRNGNRIVRVSPDNDGVRMSGSRLSGIEDVIFIALQSSPKEG